MKNNINVAGKIIHETHRPPQCFLYTVVFKTNAGKVIIVVALSRQVALGRSRCAGMFLVSVVPLVILKGQDNYAAVLGNL